MARNSPLNIHASLATKLNKRLVLKVVTPIIVFAVVLLAPTPAGLSNEGQKALAVMSLAVALWASEALPIAVTGLLGVVLLILLGGRS